MRVKVNMPRTEMLKYQQWVKQLTRDNTLECQRLLTATLYSIRSRAVLMAKTITDTGVMAGSIYVSQSTNKLNGAVYTNTLYSPFKEWGTGMYVSVPAFVKQDFGVNSMDWKGKGIRQVNSLPVPFLFENARIGFDDMTQKLRKMGFK